MPRLLFPMCAIILLLGVAPWADQRMARGEDPKPPAMEGSTPGESRTFAPDLGMVMQWCPPGEFLMGTDTGDADEKPAHRVRLTRGFWMGRTEVTQGQWLMVMGTNRSRFKGTDHPVERVIFAPPGAPTNTDCTTFCKSLTQRERKAGRLPAGFSYRIPTEAQWEYACRAGSTGDYAGDLDAMAWYKATSGDQTHPVAQKRPNAWGLHDMHGNVWEWCAERLLDYPAGLAVDPIDFEASSYLVIRGGCWRSGAAYCRSAARDNAHQFNRGSSTIGFRVVLCADPRPRSEMPASAPKAPPAAPDSQAAP